jgi:hypothetical protein
MGMWQIFPQLWLQILLGGQSKTAPTPVQGKDQ